MNTNENANKQIVRESNLELLRIIAMVLIVAHHYVANSGLISSEGPINSDPLSLHSLFLLIMGAWGKTGINCFVLFSGYFMCYKNITLKKFIKLLCEIQFYRITITGIFWLSGYEKFTMTELVNVLCPVVHLTNDFPSAYLVFFLFIPFLNILIHHLNEKQHVYLLLLASFSYVFLGTLKPLFSVSFNYASWFMVLYLISSYIRLYPKRVFNNKKLWGVSCLASVIISSLSVLICAWVGTRINRVFYYGFVIDCNTMLAVVTGLSTFMFFKNADVPQSRFINTVARSTFGVLLIHNNSEMMRRWLWKDMLNNVAQYYKPTVYLHAVLSVAVIFIVCTVLDIVRIKLIETPFMKMIDEPLNILTVKYKSAESRLFHKLGIQAD